MLLIEDEVDVTDRTLLVVVAGRAVVHDLEVELVRVLRALLVVCICPGAEVGREFVVRDDIDAFDVGNGSEVVDDPLDHRLASDLQEGLGLGKSQRIKASGIASGENKDIHGSAKNAASGDSEASSLLNDPAES